MENWLPMIRGYLISISIETPILLIGLSARHSIGVRLFSGVWLTACTYPILWLVLPELIDPRTHLGLYLAVGETFVPIAECGLFWAAFGSGAERGRWSMSARPHHDHCCQPRVVRDRRMDLCDGLAWTGQRAAVVRGGHSFSGSSKTAGFVR